MSTNENKQTGGPIHRKRSSSKGVSFLTTLFIILIIVAGSFFLYQKFKKKKTDDVRTEKEVASLVKDLSKYMFLPNEDPLVFTISDIDSLIREQAFFTNAQNGDVLFIFPQSAKAIVFSPKRKRVVNAGPVSFDENQLSTPSVNQSQNQTVSPITPIVNIEETETSTSTDEDVPE